MTDWLKQWTIEDILAAPEKEKPKAFAQYCQQTVGIAWPTVKDMTILRKRCADFLENVPGADWGTLCRVAQYCRARKRRVPRVYMVIDEFRHAWRDGYLPELDPSNRQDEAVEAEIIRILGFEKRDGWRRRLLGAQGLDARRLAVEEWHKDKAERRAARLMSPVPG
jgi:hypothetical protein